MIQHEQYNTGTVAITATQPAFTLMGGYYVLQLISSTLSGSNHVDLTQLGPNGTTALVMMAGAQTGTSSVVYAYLPPGTYTLTVTGTLTGVFASVTRIPLQ